MNSDILLKRLCVSLAKLIAILINIILEYAEMLVLIGGTIRLLKISCLYRTYSIMDSLQLLFLYYLWIFLRVLGKNNGVVSFSIFYSLLFTIFFHLDEIEPKIWDPSLPYHLTQGWVGKWIHNNPKRIKSNANSCNKKNIDRIIAKSDESESSWIIWMWNPEQQTYWTAERFLYFRLSFSDMQQSLFIFFSNDTQQFLAHHTLSNPWELGKKILRGNPVTNAFWWLYKCIRQSNSRDVFLAGPVINDMYFFICLSFVTSCYRIFGLYKPWPHQPHHLHFIHPPLVFIQHIH